MKQNKPLTRKRILVIAAIAVVLVFAGFSFQKIELRNADKPFIDLTSSVGNAIGNAKKNEELAKPETVTPQPEVVDNTLEIKISGEAVYVQNSNIPLVSVANEISKKSNLNKKIILVDDYAEAVTYLKIEKMLKQAGRSFDRKAE